MEIYGSNDQLRILLDYGSQASFISESCVQRLKLNRKRTSIAINGLGKSMTERANSCVSNQIRSNIDDSFVLEMEALVLKQIHRWAGYYRALFQVVTKRRLRAVWL